MIDAIVTTNVCRIPVTTLTTAATPLQELEDILQRPPSTVFDLAIAAVNRSQAQSRSKSREESMRGLHSESKYPDSSGPSSLEIPMAMDEEGEQRVLSLDRTHHCTAYD